jgi:Tol biopolymer transport system component
MNRHPFSRRLMIGGGAAAAAGVTLGVRRSTEAQGTPPGRILFVRSGSVWQWQGGNASEVLNDGAVSDPRWSPDASQFLYVRQGGSFSDLYVRDAATGADTQLTFNESIEFPLGSKEYAENSFWVIDPSWSASGVIGYASDSYTPYAILMLFIMNFVGADPLQMQGDIDDQGNYQNIEGVSLSSDGTVAAFATRRVDPDTVEFYSCVGLQDLGSQETGLLVDDRSGSFDPAMEPNGSRVAMAIRSGEMLDVWLVDRDGGARTQITNGANAQKPCWSSDGSWLGYLVVVDYKFEAWAVSVSGASIGQPVKLFNFDDLDAPSGLSWTMS